MKLTIERGNSLFRFNFLTLCIGFYTTIYVLWSSPLHDSKIFVSASEKLASIEDTIVSNEEEQEIYIQEESVEEVVAVDEEVMDEKESTNISNSIDLLLEESSILDELDDGFLDPISPDPSCELDPSSSLDNQDSSCWAPPDTTIEEIEIEVTIDEEPGDEVIEQIEKSCENNQDGDEICSSENTSKKFPKLPKKKKKIVDKHWGYDQKTLRMRDTLREMGMNFSGKGMKRPPIFLMPGLASTRLVSWKHKPCSSKIVSDIKVLDQVWLNIGKLLELGTIGNECWCECLTLGLNQSDSSEGKDGGCKLRPDEGLDAISSLAPNSASSNLIVGTTNTVYAWLTQWLADNLGYDVSSMIGLPYDWRLSPNVMESRDGFLTLTRRRIEAAVSTNGSPGIFVAHSMGNAVFRYFLEWLRHQFRLEAFARYKKAAARRSSNSGKGWLSNTAQQPSQIEVESTGHQQQQQQQQQQKASVPFSRDEDEPQVIDESVEKSEVQERIKFMANSLVTGFDDLVKTFFQDEEKKREKKESEEQNNILLEEVEERIINKERSLWELAEIEGDEAWLDWLEKHIWTYIGLSAPLLGAINPLRSVISGENMGLPFSEADARKLELSFGCTNTVNPISTKMGFCDNEEDSGSLADSISKERQLHKRTNLACLEDVVEQIENSETGEDAWKNYDVLYTLLKKRVDWDFDFPMISIRKEKCKKNEKAPCAARSTFSLGPKDAQDGSLFTKIADVWKEEKEPLIIKREQLEQSFWNSPFPNMLNFTWDRPHIKHVIMAYGVDVPTEVGYLYRKEEEIISEDTSEDTDEPTSAASTTPKTTTTSSTKSSNNKGKTYDGIPKLHTVITEEPGGKLWEEFTAQSRSVLLKKKQIKRPLVLQGRDSDTPDSDSDPDPDDSSNNGTLLHSGDGTIPYLSLSWAHTWLLHSTRAMQHSYYTTDEDSDDGENETRKRGNPLKSIKISHRPQGGSEWIKGSGNKYRKNKQKKKKKKNSSSSDEEAVDNAKDDSNINPDTTGDEDEDDEDFYENIEKIVRIDGDTGTNHPHGTKYKPEMIRFQSEGKSRNTGMQYTTTVIEALGVEHKETTRNYDILASVFSETLQYLHDDLGLV